MIDTGATISCISYNTYKAIDWPGKRPLEATHIPHVTGVGDNRVPVLGSTVIPITIAAQTFQHTFVVLQDASVPLIFGLDFIVNQKIILNFEKNEMTLNDGLTVAALFSPSTDAIVGIDRSVTIPARSETIIPIRVHNKRWNNATSILVPSHQFTTDWQIAAASTVMTIQDGKGVCQVINPTEQDIILVTGVILGHLEPVTQVFAEEDAPTVQQVSVSQEHTPLDDITFDLTDTDLTDTQIGRLKQFLAANRDVFAKDLSELGTTHLCSHVIDTGDHPPISQRPYRVCPEKKAEIERQIDEMLEFGIIKPSMSKWNAPVVLVRKKDQSFRFAIDYRRLNAITCPINFPLPRLDDALDVLKTGSIFSIMDLRSGYWQIPMHPDSIDKTAFICHKGVFSFKKLPFGLRNAPLQFQAVMESALRSINFKHVLIYVDDLLCFSPDFETHLQHLESVFKHLRAAGLKLKPSKCKFAAKEVTYLGHIISKEGVKVDPDKTDAVRTFPVPKTQTGVRSFLGLANYYRRFIKGFAQIAAPLNNLLRDNTPFEWTDSCQEAFDRLKTALISAPILAFPDFEKQFILSTDASGHALGYILAQKDENDKERVISYGGRALRPAEQRWTISERETLALVEGIRYYRVYLAGRRFTAITDHSATQFLHTTKDPSGKLGRWSIFLQEYDFQIKYKPGRAHGNADALSRREYPPAQSDEQTIDSLPGVDALPIHTPSASVHDTDKDTGFKDLAESNDVSTSCTQAIQTHELQAQIPPVPQQTQNLDAYSSDTDGMHSQTPPLHENTHTSVNTQQTQTDHTCHALHGHTDISLRDMQRQDIQVKVMIQYLEEDILPDDPKLARKLTIIAHDHCLDDNGILYHLHTPRKAGKDNLPHRQLVVPHALRNDVILAHHDSIAGGSHQGIERTFAHIRTNYYWPSMYNDIVTYVKSCEQCQQAKRFYNKSNVPLNPMPIPRLFQRFHIDIIGPLEKTEQGNRYILLIVCAYSRWPEAFPLKTQEAKEIAKVLFDNIICRYGAPDELLSDRGQNFLSKLITQLCELFQITRLRTSAYHPQTNATCERFNSTLEQTLRTYCEKDTKDWDKLLQPVLLAYRITPCTSSTLVSPYFLLFKQEARLPIDTSLLPVQSQPVDPTLGDIISSFDKTREIVHANITRAQQKYKTQHDKKAKPHNYILGQRVWVYFPKSKVGKTPKLQRKWRGPYYICMIKGNTFILRDCAGNQELPSPVHADRLKPYFDPQDRPTNHVYVNDDSTDEDEVEDTNTQAQLPNTNPTGQRSQQGTEPGHQPLDPPPQGHRSRQVNEPSPNKPIPSSKKATASKITDHAPVATDPTQSVQQHTPNDYYQVEKIIGCKTKQGKKYYRIKWANYSQAHCTWEPIENIPTPLIRDYHIKYTQEGKRRKKKMK